MSNDLDATWARIKQIAAASTRPTGQCQGLMQDIVKGLGGAVTGYASANAAKAAGQLNTSAPPADQIVFVYYNYPTYGHVDIEYRGERIANSSHVTTKLNANGSTGIVKAGAYPSSMTRIGWSPTNGRNVLPLIQKADPAPTPASPTQRVVKIEQATRRSTPSTKGTQLETMHVGFAHDYPAFVRSPLDGGTVGDSNIWFDGGGWFMHSSMFSDPSTTGMADETDALYPPAPTVQETPPEVEPEPPTSSEPEPPADDTPPADEPPADTDTPPATGAEDPTGDEPATQPDEPQDPVTEPAEPTPDEPPTAEPTVPNASSVWVLIATALAGGIGWLIAWITSLFH